MTGTRDSCLFCYNKDMLYRQYYLSPIGRLCLVASDQALYGIWLEGQKHFQAGIKEEELVDTSNPILKMTRSG